MDHLHPFSHGFSHGFPMGFPSFNGSTSHGRPLAARLSGSKGFRACTSRSFVNWDCNVDNKGLEPNIIDNLYNIVYIYNA